MKGVPCDDPSSPGPPPVSLPRPRARVRRDGRARRRATDARPAGPDADAHAGARAAPPPAAKPWYEEIAVNGFVSASYSYNTNRPASGTNQFRVFDFDDNTFKVDVAELVLQKAVSKPGEAGFRVDAVAGGSIPRVSAAAGLFRDASGKAQDFDLQQAFVSWIAPVGSGLRLDAGSSSRTSAYEVIEGYDGYNDNATRSFLFGFAISGHAHRSEGVVRLQRPARRDVRALQRLGRRAGQQQLEEHRRCSSPGRRRRP